MRCQKCRKATATRTVTLGGVKAYEGYEWVSLEFVHSGEREYHVCEACLGPLAQVFNRMLRKRRA